MTAVAQLFARLSQEIEEQRPKNCIHFIVDFLCKHYPEHLHGFASIWQMDPDLERERHEVVNFFKAHKISTAVAAHFTNAGYDTLDTLTTLNKESLVDVEAFNNVKWLPGHKVRLQQIFGEIAARVRAYRQQYGNSANPGARKAGAGVPRTVAAAFNALDRNHDGLISRQEFAAIQGPSYAAPLQQHAHAHAHVPLQHHVGGLSAGGLQAPLGGGLEIRGGIAGLGGAGGLGAPGAVGLGAGGGGFGAGAPGGLANPGLAALMPPGGNNIFLNKPGYPVA
eukprot:TRINITY_DN31182_c0_g1_i1.p1 TRINITY_DN31182_c0_g1~~TRINITY_DN31182_c0_g1_i1.p1  ORF type:complete len:327 (+),score=72.44 TRINITY_DN31182_c0_g1_i1:143-982(+)